MTESYLESIRGSLVRILEKDDNAYVLGEDIVDPYGGAFKVTKGLSTRFPGRVLPMPISEAAIIGAASGLALRGMTAIAEIMFGDFLALAADQILNHTSKLHLMYGRELEMPVVIRTAVGGGRGYGPTHSQSLERMFFGVPGLQILAPSLFHSPGEALERAVSNRKPTLFVEHKRLYPVGLKLADEPPLYVAHTNGQWPTAIVKNFAGEQPDVTIIAYGGTSLLVERVLQQMVQEEVRITACVPLQLHDVLAGEDVLTHCAASRRVVVVEEGPRYAGWGAEIAAWLHQSLGERLATPVIRVGAANSIIPNARSLENAVLPSTNDIEKAIVSVLSA